MHACGLRLSEGASLPVSVIDSKQMLLLPCGYYHLVATVPEQLRHAFLSDQ